MRSLRRLERKGDKLLAAGSHDMLRQSIVNVTAQTIKGTRTHQIASEARSIGSLKYKNIECKTLETAMN
jgi:hypothetical protein